MNFINLTPHDINIKGRIIPASGNVARVILDEVVCDNIDGIDIIRTKVTSIEFNHVPVLSDILIVSTMVLDNLPKDHPYYFQTYAPDTGPSAVRNDSGHIVMVNRLKKS